MRMLLRLTSGEGVTVGELLGHEETTTTDHDAAVDSNNRDGSSSSSNGAANDVVQKPKDSKSKGEVGKAQVLPTGQRGRGRGRRGGRAQGHVRVHLDLKRSASNAFAFVLLRRALRGVGGAYARRCEVCALLLAGVVGAGAALAMNVSFWAKVLTLLEGSLRKV